MSGSGRDVKLACGSRLALVLLLAGPAAASVQPGIEDWYDIASEHGGRLGYASREVHTGPEGRETIDSQQLLIRNPDGPSTRISSRTVLREDQAGRTVSISE